MRSDTWLRRNADIIALALIITFVGIGAQAANWFTPSRPAVLWTEPANSYWRRTLPERFPVRVWKLRASRAVQQAVASNASELRGQAAALRGELRAQANEIRQQAQEASRQVSQSFRCRRY